MDKENVVCIYNGELFTHKEEQNYVICRKMGGIKGHHSSEVEQTWKDKYCMFSLSLSCGI
jgi:hypothetical protein